MKTVGTIMGVIWSICMIMLIVNIIYEKLEKTTYVLVACKAVPTVAPDTALCLLSSKELKLADCLEAKRLTKNVPEGVYFLCAIEPNDMEKQK